MNKEEFVDQLAKKSGLTKKDARKALDATLDLIISNCAKKQKVTFVGFGTFAPRKRKATTNIRRILRSKNEPSDTQENQCPSQDRPRL